jgi:hypothetical protein
MRFFLFGPRVLGVRPGVSFSPRDFQKLAYPSGTASKTEGITGGFVYVLKDESGRHKIGSSVDPIQRIAQLQTGSAERLDFAFIAAAQAGAYTRIERYAHDLLKFQKIPNGGDEWFAVPASIAIGAVMEASSRLGDPVQQVQPIMVPQILEIAAQEAKKISKAGGGVFGHGILGGLPWFIRWPIGLTIGTVVGLVFAGIIELLIIAAHSGSGS